MYYYIMESAGKKNAIWQEKVKDILGDIGIAGETVLPSSARTVEELASLGIAKGYSTLVAVGSEKIVNKIVNSIIAQKENPEVVLGIIPDNFEGAMARKIKVTNLRQACEMLKFRKLQSVDACLIEPNKYYITEAIIKSNKTTDAYLISPEIKAGVIFNEIIIRPGLEIEVIDNSVALNSKKILGWLFGKQETPNSQSLFHTKKIKIEVVDGGAPVLIENEVVAKTPIICQNKPKALKIIVARDIIKEDN